MCPEASLIIKVDGSQHGSPADQTRDAWMRHNGLRVLRFWNNDVVSQTKQVLAAIGAVLTLLPSDLRPPFPASQGKGNEGEVR